MTRIEFLVILGHFHPSNNPENQNFEKMKKTTGYVIILHLCTKNHDHMMHVSWDMECDRQNCFVILGHFLPFYLLIIQKIKLLKKWNKTPEDIIILHMYTINDDHIIHGSWDMEHDRRTFLSFWTIFLPFYPPSNPENQNFEKMKKILGGIILRM